MKKLTVALLFFVSVSHAELLNFDQVFHSVRTGVFLDQHLDSLAGVYATVVSLHNGNNLSLIDLNGGYLKQLDSSRGSPLAEIGLRLDNILSVAISSPWGQSHVSASPLPTLECGPFLALSTRHESGSLKVNVLYGAGLAIGF